MKSYEDLRQSLQKGLNPRMKYDWGEAFWRVVFNSVLSDHSDEKLLLQHLAAFLPCKQCKVHYEAYLSSNAIPQKKEDVFRWCRGLEESISGRSTPNRYADILQDISLKKKIWPKKATKAKKAKKEKKDKKEKKNHAKLRKRRRRRRNNGGCSACGG